MPLPGARWGKGGARVLSRTKRAKAGREEKRRTMKRMTTGEVCV